MVKIKIEEEEMLKIIADAFDIDVKDIYGNYDCSFEIEIEIDKLKKKDKSPIVIPYPVREPKEPVEPHRPWKPWKKQPDYPIWVCRGPGPSVRYGLLRTKNGDVTGEMKKG